MKMFSSLAVVFVLGTLALGSSRLSCAFVF